jgi:predicted transcriptional regulator
VKIEIAKEMIREGLDITLIAKLTGLTINEIEALESD